jgi:hypothetical protein
MKKIGMMMAAILAMIVANAQITINDANAQPRKLDASFNAIKVSGGIDVYIAQGNEEGLAVSAARTDYISHIETKVEKGVLIISTSGNWFRNPKFRVYVSVKNLEKIHASGASDVHIQGKLKFNTLKLVLDGASDFKGEVEVENLDIHQSGASDITISGKAVNTKIEASGASDIKGFDLVTDYLDVDVSGASDTKITVNKEMNVKASGASDVRYKGSAVIKQYDVSGASSLKKS